jgi:hypothetical protein
MPTQLPDSLTLGALLDAIADRVAVRLLSLFERTDVRAIALARLDLSTLANMLDVAGDAAPIVKARQLVAQVAEQLSATKGGR